MKELIARLRNDCYQEDEVRSHAKEAADALERLISENAALREGLDGWHSRYLDAEVERDALKEQMTADRKQFLDMRNERDALAQNAERVRVYKQRYFEAIAERDALRERLDAITKISALDCAIAGEKHD